MNLNKKFRRGLVVGKFCPLHCGHEYLINSALGSCEEVLVISYTKPEFENCEPANREQWIEALFPEVKRLVIDDTILREQCQRRQIPAREIPHNDAPDHEHREFCGWLCHDVLQLTIDAVFTSEDYGDGFAESLTKYFRSLNKTTHSVEHVCVDKARTSFPISGTAVRTDPYQNRKFLSPIVYGSFVKRACFLGGESSGKTTIAKLLAEHYSTVWVAEYGRELWDEKDGKLQFEDMLHIAKTQIAREEKLTSQTDTWLFCDTSPLTTLFYSISMFGNADVRLIELARRKYDLVFLCVPDFPFVQDGTRRNADFSQQQHDWYCDQLSRSQIEFTLLTGDVEQRIEEVSRTINSLHERRLKA